MPRQYTQRVECICAHCGTSFARPPGDIHSARVYCSVACRRIGVRATAEDFWQHVDKAADCWIWTGRRSMDGYGRFFSNHTEFRAHRYSYALVNGEIPAGIVICHRCDTPLCVNPAHLFPGTPDDNAKDMVSKDRQAKGERMRAIRREHAARGERHGNARFTEQDIRDIRARYDCGEAGPTEIAALYGASQGAICHIVARRSWKHVT